MPTDGDVFPPILILSDVRRIATLKGFRDTASGKFFAEVEIFHLRGTPICVARRNFASIRIFALTLHVIEKFTTDLKTLLHFLKSSNKVYTKIISWEL